MKKLVTGMVALFLVIGASAFIGLKNTQVKKAATEDPLYWYSVNNDHESQTGDLINTGGAMTRTDLLINYSTSVPCSASTGDACVRGFAEPLAETTTDDGDDSFRKGN